MPTDSILASVIKTEDSTSRKAGIKDYSIYRTPSGKHNMFLLMTCELILTVVQFNDRDENLTSSPVLLKLLHLFGQMSGVQMPHYIVLI